MAPEIMKCNCLPFLALLPPKNLDNQNSEKMKKKPGDIIVLHTCIINDDHDIWFLGLWSVTDRVFCHFRPIFAFLSP